MPTLIWCDGFEFQTYSNTAINNNGTYSVVTGCAADTTTFKSGGGIASVRITSSGSVGRLTKAVGAGNRTVVISFDINLQSRPGSTQIYGQVSGPANTPRIQIDSSGNLTVGLSSTGFSSTIATLNAGTWYHIDWKADVSGATFTTTLRVDGGADTTVNGAGTAADITNVQIGSSAAASTIDVNYDNYVASYTLGDYPLGSFNVKALNPSGDGTHNGGTNTVEKSDGTDIVTPGVTDAYTMINEFPVETTDFIKQSASGAGNYAECTFENSASEPTIAGVSLWAAGAGSSINTFGGIIRFVDSSNNTIQDFGLAGNFGNGTTLRMGQAFIDSAGAPGGDGWSYTDLDGMKVRIGFSTDVSPLPNFYAAQIQYAVPAFSSYTGSAALTGAGTMSVSGVRTRFGTAGLTGAGSLALTGKILAKASASLTGAGTMTVAGLANHLGAANLAGAGTLSAAGVRTVYGLAALLGQGTCSASGSIQIGGSAHLTGETRLEVHDGDPHSVSWILRRAMVRSR